MLATYISQVQRLLNDEQSQFYSTTDLTSFINLARNTIAAQSECLVYNGTLATVNGTQTYGLSAITAPNASLQNAINARSIRSIVSGIGAVLEVRPWQWFQNYYLQGSNTTATGVPTIWAMQNQGVSGNIWFWAIPNGTILMSVEASWIPVPLVTDATPEALSYPWTDAVQYFASYMAYLNAQRSSDAQRMLQLYNAFMKSARVGVTPEFTPGAFPMLKPLLSQPTPGGEGQLG